jgi:O-antigen/teichoic acid export membrane protein
MKNILDSASRMLVAQKEFIKRVYSFFIIKVGLVFTRWSLILISYYKLDLTDFALFASTYSLIEILRIVAEFGTEGFIYSRLLRKKTDSKIIYTLIELRLLLAMILSIIFISIGSFKYGLNKALIFALIPLLSIESSSFIFLQKKK